MKINTLPVTKGHCGPYRGPSGLQKSKMAASRPDVQPSYAVLCSSLLLNIGGHLVEICDIILSVLSALSPDSNLNVLNILARLFVAWSVSLSFGMRLV